jgi:hypothetical protein
MDTALAAIRTGVFIFSPEEKEKQRRFANTAPFLQIPPDSLVPSDAPLPSDSTAAQAARFRAWFEISTQEIFRDFLTGLCDDEIYRGFGSMDQGMGTVLIIFRIAQDPLLLLKTIYALVNVGEIPYRHGSSEYTFMRVAKL